MGQDNSAAPIGSIPSGNFTRLCSESATNSANPPFRPCPMPSPNRHRCSRPLVQRSHLPQASVRMLTTRSPLVSPVTFRPVFSITPEIS